VLEFGSDPKIPVLTRPVRHLGRVCAQGPLNHFPIPKRVLTGTQELLNLSLLRGLLELREL
jgi:hypothetical protein